VWKQVAFHTLSYLLQVKDKEDCQWQIAYATLILSHDNPKAKNQCAQLAHPDLHFAFPTATNDKVKKDPISSLFMDEWRTFVKEQPYGSLFDWLCVPWY